MILIFYLEKKNNFEIYIIAITNNYLFLKRFFIRLLEKFEKSKSEIILNSSYINV